MSGKRVDAIEDLDDSADYIYQHKETMQKNKEAYQKAKDEGKNAKLEKLKPADIEEIQGALDSTLDTLNLLKEAANKTSKEIGEHVDTVTNQMDHSMETLETNIKVAQAPIEETLKSLDATQTIETLLGVTGIVSQLGFILNNVANAWDAVTDPDVSGWYKLKVVSGALVSSLSMYLTMASSLKSLLPQIATQLGVNVVAEAALNAEKAKGNILTKDQITNEMMLSAAKKMSVKDLLKETIATAAATAAKWLHAAAQAVLNLLQGNFTALGVAAAAALVAIAGAAIYGVAQLIKYNSEQEQLNRTVERSSEALNKAQEKFQTLQDTLSGYKDATSQMEGLTEGTVEFYNSLIEANERALELVNTREFPIPEYLRMTPVGLEEEEKYKYERLDLVEKIQYLPSLIKEMKFYQPNYNSGPYELSLLKNYDRLKKINRSSNLKEIYKK